MKSLRKTNLLIFTSFLVTALGCQSTSKQPTDPYSASRIPAPATYSYLGQQPDQPVYSPPGAASTYPPTVPVAPSTVPAALPVTPSPTPGPLGSQQPASTYGSLDGATLYATAATSSAVSNSATAAQTVPSAPSSVTATQSLDALAVSAPTTVSPAPIDTWSTSSTQIVTQVVE